MEDRKLKPIYAIICRWYKQLSKQYNWAFFFFKVCSRGAKYRRKVMHKNPAKTFIVAFSRKKPTRNKEAFYMRITSRVKR